MAKLNNPTRTAGTENRWMREINKRYSSLQKDINEKLHEISGPIQTNATIGLNAEQQKLFMAWLLERIKLVTGDEPPLNWQGEHQLNSYIRALESVRASLISQGVDISLTDKEIVESQGFQFSATPSLGSSIVSDVIHQDSLEFLFTRSYESLKGWNDLFVKEVRQITFDGVKNGSGIKDIASEISKRTGVAKSRAETIARTEVISAYREGAINETQRASEEVGDDINMRWITALDGRVRHLHSSWHGTISTPEETRRKGNISPYNCRCSQVPVIKGVNDTPSKNAKFETQRNRLIEMESGK